LDDPIKKEVFHKNEVEHIIERLGTPARIKAKTCWNADTLRGDYADVLILDEWQLMNEDTWDYVGRPMLLDNDGDAVFLYTPPSLHSRSVTKAGDPQHAMKMFERHKNDKDGRWRCFHWTSYDNPYLSKESLAEIQQDMTRQAYLMEILAQDMNEAPGALWKREDVESNRVASCPELMRVIVAVDPSTTSAGDEAGIVAQGIDGNKQGYLLADRSLQGSPLKWAKEAVDAYYEFEADTLIAEANQGGEMVEITIHQVDPNVPVKLVHASRGKQTRAEPIAAKGEKGEIHHVGKFDALEDELCLWIPGDPSPNRLDAYVWGFTELMLGDQPGVFFVSKGQTAADKSDQYVTKTVPMISKRYLESVRRYYMGE
jgi:hypothetical protein